MPDPVLAVDGLCVDFRRSHGEALRAVRSVSFSVEAGETVALMGESGSGKSTIARAILHLTPISAGEVRFRGEDVTRARRDRLRHMRARAQMIFQNPAAALHPGLTARESLLEPMKANHIADPGQRLAEVVRLCALDDGILGARPGALSGGQLQRVAIARALALHPELLIADEPLSALDVSLQAQVTNLLLRLRAELGLSMLFISHDIALVRQFADRVLILYRGQVVEEGPVEAVIFNPQHPYTAALIAASPDPDRPWLAPFLDGNVGVAAEDRCLLSPRCPHAQPPCRASLPALVAADGDAAHRAACFFPGCAGNPLALRQRSSAAGEATQNHSG